MSYIFVDHLCKSFVVRKKREKGSLLREKETVHALKDVSFEIEKGASASPLQQRKFGREA